MDYRVHLGQRAWERPQLYHSTPVMAFVDGYRGATDEDDLVCAISLVMPDAVMAMGMINSVVEEVNGLPIGSLMSQALFRASVEVWGDG